MSQLICLECGNIFDECEAHEIREYHDEVPGGFYESWTVCPCCGGDYEEAHDCVVCGGAFLETELVGGYYCKECFEKELTVENMKEYISSDYDDYAEWLMSKEEMQKPGGGY